MKAPVYLSILKKIKLVGDIQLDDKRIRADKDKVVEALKGRSGNFPIDQVIKLDEEKSDGY